jgi:hypothetical protein
MISSINPLSLIFAISRMCLLQKVGVNFIVGLTLLAHYQSVFVQKYGQYLEEKVLVFKMLNVEFEKDPTITKSFTVDEAFEKIPRLQSQMNALLNCRASKNHINNPIIVYGFTLLLKDSFKLYRSLNDAIIHVLGKVSELVY